jgi:hypothetical protein
MMGAYAAGGKHFKKPINLTLLSGIGIAYMLLKVLKKK